MPLMAADVSEVMRSGQKDGEVTASILQPLLNKTVELLAKAHSRLLGDGDDSERNRYSTTGTDWLSWSSELELLTNVMYYLFTTISGQQTIGEEYVNIVQVDASYKHHPKAFFRTIMVSLHCCTQYLLNKLIDSMLKYVNANSWMAESKKPLVRDILNCSSNVFNWCYRLQRSLFFLRLSSENIAKHLTCTNYVSIRRTPMSSYKWFTLLGYFGIIQSAVTFFQGLRAIHKAVKNATIKSKSTSSSVVSAHSKCPLCYDTCKDITCTPCGHLFCWNCIYPWASATPRCPICRLNCEPGKLVLLVNFDM